MYLTWNESAHFTRPEELDLPELPKLVTPHTIEEISEAIKQDSRFSKIHPKNQRQVIEFAITRAKESAMLIEA